MVNLNTLSQIEHVKLMLLCYSGAFNVDFELIQYIQAHLYPYQTSTIEYFYNT